MRRLKRIYRHSYNQFVKQGQVNQAILNQAKKEGNIVYGAQSIKKQIGIFARPTYDFDVLSHNPKKSAKRTEKKLDSIYGYDSFYVKPAMHPGTWKVIDKGYDQKANTDDDVGVADYTQMPKPIPKHVMYNGVRYRKLELERQAKMKAMKDPQYAFRYKKDSEDYTRINIATGRRK